MKKSVSVLITDLDNTLYDWVQMWYASFVAMLQEIIRISDIPQEILESEIQTVFQRYGTTEYAFLIQELPSLKAKHPGKNLTEVYADAIKAYNVTRASTLKLYPGVMEVFEELKGKGCKVIAFTESSAFYTMRRLKVLKLDGVVDFVYSPPDHSKPLDINRFYDDEQYSLTKTIHRFLRKGVLKPHPETLLQIINDDGIRARPEEVIYVGDNLMKDITMAQSAGITDVYAKYGVAQYSEAYEMLRKVTHWKPDDVQKEKSVYADLSVTPSYVLNQSFSELKDLFEFIPFIDSSTEK
jgi:FMN phosphatase YigB (HAD superfamily)